MRANRENVVGMFCKSEDQRFKEACSKVPPPWATEPDLDNPGKKMGIKPKRRQAAKWLRGKGIAFKHMKGLL
jgi:hypothetical protein